ncbi:hypothetical protein O3M35_003341 [Rhynocoris fuscipes]|uniref:Dehydrogenase/reductase SDR family member 7 n=1 Tax=Rhynocoris fuscipes TaxID=488301 RepID=A0AAW1CRA5_9HEMI
MFYIIGVIFVLYLFIWTILLVFVDCDLVLLWYLHFGKKLNEFRNKIIWVTGASSGIGEYLAIELAKSGAKIIITARSETNLEKVKKRCIEAGANEENISVLPFDLTEEVRLPEIFNKAVNCFGQLDILVNNAGRSQRASFDEIETKVDREIFDLNTFPAISLSRLAVKYFEESRIKGQIVATSSVAGLFAVPYSCSYNASKSALNAYLNTLRLETMDSNNLDVTILCPGPVFSNLLENCFTAKSGEKLGLQMNANDKRMTTERCAYLSAIAIANRLQEAWIAEFPCIFLVYINMYYPNFARWIVKRYGVKRLMNVRDSRQIVTKND